MQPDIPSNVLNKDLYIKARNIIYSQYEKPSAYRSGALVSKYKELGGEYSGKKTKQGLTRWYKEAWTDVNPNKTATSYPVYRPTRRVNKNTPKTVMELSTKTLQRQSALKQKIRGDANLPKFV